ncbi:MAG TPA: Mov34/MPN/PAD-1 family protein [Haliangiales bacterium]|nr:Mov34/MPN/PAD-1 family protein [Haliangiales bacterium]
MSGDLRIPPELLAEVYAHARERFPAECCGWLAGPRGEDAVTRVVRAESDAAEIPHLLGADRTEERAYAFGRRDLLAFMRALDGPEPPRAIYHSHPNGRAYFSDADHAAATAGWDEPTAPVFHLVVGVRPEGVVEAKLFDWDPARKAFVVVARFGGEIE